jgi:hypothetical protein
MDRKDIFKHQIKGTSKFYRPLKKVIFSTTCSSKNLLLMSDSKNNVALIMACNTSKPGVINKNATKRQQQRSKFSLALLSKGISPEKPDEILLLIWEEYRDKLDAVEIACLSRVCKRWRKMFLQKSWNILCFTNTKPLPGVLSLLIKRKGIYNRVWYSKDSVGFFDLISSEPRIQFNALTINIDHIYIEEDACAVQGILGKLPHCIPSSQSTDQQIMVCVRGEEGNTSTTVQKTIIYLDEMMDNVSSIAIESSLRQKSGTQFGMILDWFQHHFLMGKSFSPKELLLFGINIGEFRLRWTEIEAMMKYNLRLIFFKECSAQCDFQIFQSKYDGYDFNSRRSVHPCIIGSRELQNETLLALNGDFAVPLSIPLDSVSSMIIRQSKQKDHSSQEDDLDLSEIRLKKFFQSDFPIPERLRLCEINLDTELLEVFRKLNLGSICFDECIIDDVNDYSRFLSLKVFEFFSRTRTFASLVLPPNINHFSISYNNNRTNSFRIPKSSGTNSSWILKNTVVDASHCGLLKRM